MIYNVLVIYHIRNSSFSIQGLFAFDTVRKDRREGMWEVIWLPGMTVEGQSAGGKGPGCDF